VVEPVQQDYSAMVGMTLEQAQNHAISLGLRTVRVTSYNGQPMLGTADFRLDRLNVGVDNDLVTSVGGLG
jgi:hypothetical protein